MWWRAGAVASVAAADAAFWWFVLWWDRVVGRQEPLTFAFAAHALLGVVLFVSGVRWMWDKGGENAKKR